MRALFTFILISTVATTAYAQTNPKQVMDWSREKCESTAGYHDWEAEFGECGACVCREGNVFEPRLFEGDGACVSARVEVLYEKMYGEAALAKPPACVVDESVGKDTTTHPVASVAAPDESPIRQPGTGVEPEPGSERESAEADVQAERRDGTKTETEAANEPETEMDDRPSEESESIIFLGEKRTPEWCQDDEDNDGVANCQDYCPDEAENVNGYFDDDGCLDISPEETAREAFAKNMEEKPQTASEARAGKNETQPEESEEVLQIKDIEDPPGLTKAEQLKVARAERRNKHEAKMREREQAKAERGAMRQEREQAKAEAKTKRKAEQIKLKAEKNRDKAKGLWYFERGQRIYDAQFPFSQTDTDLDSIPDELDSCPHEPEDLDVREDIDGCPEADKSHFELEYDAAKQRINGFELVDDHVAWFDAEGQLSQLAKEIAQDLARVMRDFDVEIMVRCYLPRPNASDTEAANEQARRHARMFAAQLIGQAAAIGVPDAGHRILPDGLSRMSLKSEEFVFAIRSY